MDGIFGGYKFSDLISIEVINNKKFNIITETDASFYKSLIVDMNSEYHDPDKIILFIGNNRFEYSNVINSIFKEFVSLDMTLPVYVCDIYSASEFANKVNNVTDIMPGQSFIAFVTDKNIVIKVYSLNDFYNKLLDNVYDDCTFI